MQEIQAPEGYKKAIELLYQCATDDGFIATPTDHANYRRIWGRDGVIIGLSALMTEEDALKQSCAKTLRTLAHYQGPHGEIPSNVDTRTERISYGGMTGRVDADLWFIIGCGEYWKVSKDEAFLDAILPAMKKTQQLLGAWEFNNRGLLYIPQTGDWADEYLQNGYVLYDQLLYLQAFRTLSFIQNQNGDHSDQPLVERINRLKDLIWANYWFEDNDEIPDHVYHKILFEKGKKAARSCRGQHWMPFFSPHGYGYRFDGFANVLASLLGVSDDARTAIVDGYIADQIESEDIYLLPAFYPVIEPVDEDWQNLQMTFSYTFKNHPYEYHNGGRWQMLSGLYAADLAARGKKDKAGKYLSSIHWANALEMNGEPWGFPEYVHGKNFTAEGNHHQGWSAAGAVIAYQALNGKRLFNIADPLD